LIFLFFMPALWQVQIVKPTLFSIFCGMAVKPLLTFLLTSLTAISTLRALAGDTGAFPADITQGGIRCVMMSVGQTTVFPNKEDHNQRKIVWGDNAKGVPCFTVTYLVEQLGDAPLAQFVGGSVEFMSDGKPLRVGGSGYQKCFAYGAFQSFLDFGKPKVSDPKRAVIMQTVTFGTVHNLQSLSLTIEAGFGKDIQKFQFDSIRFQ